MSEEQSAFEEWKALRGGNPLKPVSYLTPFQTKVVDKRSKDKTPKESPPNKSGRI
jgi:hypothetical protein